MVSVTACCVRVEYSKLGYSSCTVQCTAYRSEIVTDSEQSEVSRVSRVIREP